MGLGANAAVVVQPHGKSICAKMGNPSAQKWEIHLRKNEKIIQRIVTFLVAQILVLLQPSVGFLKSRQRRFLLRIKNFQSVLSDAETPFCQYKEDIGALYTLPPACGQLLSI